ncbi:unnamed protein product [Cuscuta europaea]|uniref:Uncharacterized protein n=1 Tax=Cuscuta europaea TaxID=41803 RepID=A0A9P1EHT4_CUSEU|nr:unnamed protein product [Cuscuta europaea]
MGIFNLLPLDGYPYIAFPWFLPQFYVFFSRLQSAQLTFLNPGCSLQNRRHSILTGGFISYQPWWLQRSFKLEGIQRFTGGFNSYHYGRSLQNGMHFIFHFHKVITFRNLSKVSLESFSFFPEISTSFSSNYIYLKAEAK